MLLDTRHFLICPDCCLYFCELLTMTSTSSGALAVVLVLSIFTGAVPVSSYISQPVHMFNDSSAHITTHTETRLINGYNTTAYYAWIGNPIDHFHVLYPELANGSCGHYLYPSRVARRVGCEYATNGGERLLLIANE